MTSGVLGGDQVAVKRMFSLISRPLNDFKDVYYPSFAEWVSCKVYQVIVASVIEQSSHLCPAYFFIH